jgi:hypothetical protein
MTTVGAAIHVWLMIRMSFLPRKSRPARKSAAGTARALAMSAARPLVLSETQTAKASSRKII